MTAASAQAAAEYDRAIDSYLRYRADMATRMEALLAADPDFGLAHCLKGYLRVAGRHLLPPTRRRGYAMELRSADL